MNWIKAINDAIAYMEDHLSEDTGLHDIARQVNISPFHFQRAFTLIAGISPAEYMRSRRMSQAGAELARGECTVLDAALRYGYDTPESFTKAFTRFHGITPSQAKNGQSVRFMNRHIVKTTIEGGTMMEYRIEKWDAFDLVLHAESFESENAATAIPAIWESYYAQYHGLRATIGACAQLDGDDNRSVYGIGWRAEDGSGLPKGFRIIHVPAYTWIIFKCIGPATRSFEETWHRIYQEWLPATDYQFLTEGYLEKLPLGDTMAPDYVGELCIPVKV